VKKKYLMHRKAWLAKVWELYIAGVASHDAMTLADLLYRAKACKPGDDNRLEKPATCLLIEEDHVETNPMKDAVLRRDLDAVLRTLKGRQA
jgi:hypothetical protein